MSVSARAVSQDRFADCVEFLAPRERRAITLASNLVIAGYPRFLPDTVRDFVMLEDSGTVAGLLLMTKTGILLHCMDDGIDRASFAPKVSRILTGFGVRCVLGKADDTRWLESLVAISPERAVDYRLMARTPAEGGLPGGAEEAVPPLPPGASIAQATEEDADELLPLQEEYEREEVIPPGDPFNRDSCLASLRRNLRTQCIWFAREGETGKIVAKAGTNARGMGWDQLGGVYTVPERRGRGLATTLARYAAAERERMGRRVALFVKTGNAPAIRAYEKAGFVPDTDFRISYF